MGQDMPPGSEWPVAMRGQGGPLARVKKGKLPIPTPQEIIKDKLKELALKYGWDAAKWAWNKLTDDLNKPGMWDQLQQEAAKKQKQLAAKKGGGGGAVVALAFLVLATKKKRRR